MSRSGIGWGRRMAGVWMIVAALAAGVVAADVPDTPEPTSATLEAHAARFWGAVLAAPADRRAGVERDFSRALRERQGDDAVLETLAMLAEVVGPEVAKTPPTRVPGPSGDELHYRFADGRGVALTLALTDSSPARIERFGVRPLPPKVDAVAPDELSSVIGARVRQDAEAGRFSGAVLVARGDTVIHAQAVGLADRVSGRANTLDTPINLGSINKMFTAIAIAQLQAQGKLDWQDTVGKHLPDFPNAAIRDRVTIHQLLTHTSGVGSYWNAKHEARLAELDTQGEFLDLFVDDPLRFEPGEGLEYSNGGPVILGGIIEAVSGLDYYAYVREHLYLPAGMTHAEHYRRDDAQAGFARGYLSGEDGMWQENTAQLSLRGSAAGGGYASAHDLLAFARALGGGRLLPREQQEVLWTAHVRMGPMGYGYLTTIGNPGGRRWIGHDGGAPGIAAEFLYYPDEGLVIIVLANQDNAARPLREWLHALVEASIPAR